MASIYEDPSTPSPSYATAYSGVAYSGAFSPPAGTWVYVEATWLYASNMTGQTLSCADTSGNVYASVVQVQDTPGATINAVFRFYYSAAPGAIQVKLTASSTGWAAAFIAPRVVVGAAATQTTAAVASYPMFGRSWANEITTTTPGSVVYVVAGSSNTVDASSAAGTVTVGTWESRWYGDTAMFGMSQGVIGTPGPVTLGWVDANRTEYVGWVAAEVIPATAATGGGVWLGGTTVPSLNPVPAGYVVQPADMNAMAYACQFLMNKPVARVHTVTAGQALSTSDTAVNFDTVDLDPDSMFNSKWPAQLTIQTPGFYKARYGVNEGGNGVNGNGWVQVVTGANNPAGQGMANSYYYSYVAGGGSGGICGASGVIPQYLYPLDYVQVMFRGSAAASVAVSPVGPYLSLELVSI